MDDHSFPTSFPLAVRNAQAPIVDRLSTNQLIPTPDGSESRPYRSPFAMPRHRSSIVQSSIVNRQSSFVHRPIVNVGVITPPLDPLPVQGGDGSWVLSPAPFSATRRHSSINQQPQTNNDISGRRAGL